MEPRLWARWVGIPGDSVVLKFRSPVGLTSRTQKPYRAPHRAVQNFRHCPLGSCPFHSLPWDYSRVVPAAAGHPEIGVARLLGLFLGKFARFGPNVISAPAWHVQTAQSALGTALMGQHYDFSERRSCGYLLGRYVTLRDQLVRFVALYALSGGSAGLYCM